MFWNLTFLSNVQAVKEQREQNPFEAGAIIETEVSIGNETIYVKKKKNFNNL